MSGHLQEDQLKKIEEVQKQKLLRIEQQDTIHKNLTKLQTWDLAEGQTLEERRQAHKEAMIHGQLQENAAMQNAAQAQLAQATANAAAPGAPVQEQAPAKQTYKQRREQARKAKEAKKRSPVGTADTYDCVEATSRVVQERQNALKPVPKDTGGVDPRVLGAFCQGYKVNKKGKPATPEDQAKADSDNAFLAAYLSKDVERRKPYLEAFRKELMDFPLSADTASNAYMVKNAEMMKRITDKSCYYENVMKDPINKPYFDSLDPTDMELLTKKLNVLALLGSYFVNRMGGMGLNSNLGCYYDYSAQRGISSFKSNADFQQEYVGSLTAGWEQQKREILERHMEEYAAQERERMLREIAEDRTKQTAHRPEDMNFSGPAAGYATEELKRYRTMIEEHPDVYAANKPLMDQLYQEFYRGMDILNEMSFDSMVYQSVTDAKKESQKDTDQAKARLAFKKLERHMESMDAARKQLNTITQALDFYLKEKPLTDGARALLKNMGQNDADISLLEHQHEVRNVFLGDDGLVAKSNATLERSRKNGDEPTLSTSYALQALQIRESSTAGAKVAKALQGDTFKQLPKDIASKFHEIESWGADISAVQEQMKQHNVGKTVSKYVTGGGVDVINEELLELYGTYLNSDESIRYLQFMTETLKGAEVFSGDSGAVLSFLSQSLLNIYGSNYVEVSKTKASYQNGAAVSAVAQEACRSLLALPAMTRLSEEERAKLPEATQRLANQYTALLKQIQKKIDPAAAER